MKVLQITSDDPVASYIQGKESLAWSKVLKDPFNPFALDGNDRQLRELRLLHQHADDSRWLL